MKLSIIIPVYNVEDYLNQCVASVINQTYKNLEIILVDDGSTDKCPQLCDTLAKKDSRIHVIHKKNGGLSSARNAGLDIATGDFIGFVDSDDWIEEGMYEKLLGGFLDDSVGITSCDIMAVRDGVIYPYNKNWMHNEDSMFSFEEFAAKLLSTEANFTVCSKLFRKELIHSVRFREGRLNEDSLFIFDVSKRIVKYRWIMREISFAGYYYRQRGGSICNTDSYSLDIAAIENYEGMAIEASVYDKQLANVLMDYRNKRLYAILLHTRRKQGMKPLFSELVTKLSNISTLRFIRHNKLRGRAILTFLVMKYFPLYYKKSF